MGGYFIESPHEKGNCRVALEEILAKNPDLPEKFDWGCMEGEHTGWIVLEAEDESDARSKLPDILKSDARIIKVNKFTPGQIRLFHQT
ncbi:MAG: hypothetical protein V3V92_06140 [Candidatus Hydrothermarchaeales archaeon]